MRKLIDENAISNDIYIYYLQLTSGLDSSYIQFAASFREYGITLVPVSMSELDYFLKSGPIPLMVMTDSLEKNKTFLRYRRSYLDFALRSKKIVLYHLDSFGHDHTMYSEEKTGHYNRISLPATMEGISEQMIMSLQKKKSTDKAWPGGSRVTLPKIKKGEL